MKRKPKCSALQMMKVIRRNSEIPAIKVKPEHDLVFAIIGNAVADLLTKANRQGAEWFFEHEMFRIYCGVVNLDPTATVELLLQGGFLERPAEQTAVNE